MRLLVFGAAISACGDDPSMPVTARGPLVIAGSVTTGRHEPATTQVIVQVREAGCTGATLDSAAVAVQGNFRIERDTRSFPATVCVITTANPAPNPASEEFRNARIVRDSINVHTRDTTFVAAMLAYNFGVVSASTSIWGDANALLADLSLEVKTPTQTLKVGAAWSNAYTTVRVSAGDSIHLKALYQSSSAMAELSRTWQVEADMVAGFTAVIARTPVPTGCFLCAYQQRIGSTPVRLVTGQATGDTLHLMLSTLSPLSEYSVQ